MRTNIGGLVVLALFAGFPTHLRAQNLLTGPNTVAFTATSGGASPAPQTIVVNHTGPVNKTFTIAASTANGGNWLSAAQSAGLTPARFTLSAISTGLAPGLYTGTVLITSPGVPQARVDVTLSIVSAAQLSTSAPSLSFLRHTTTDVTTDEQLLFINSTGSPATFTTTATTSDGGSWLVATASVSTTPGVISVRVNPGGLAPGSYTGSIAITAQGQNQVTVLVSLTVSASPFVTVSPATVNLIALRTGNAVTQSAAIQTSGGPVPFTVSFNTSSGGNWLIVSPLNSAAPGNLDISANPAGLPSGTYTGTVQLTTAGAANPTVTIPVTFTVTDLPIISVSQRSLSFALPEATAAGSRLVRDLPAIQVTSTTGTNVNFSVSASTSNGGPWLTVGPASGSTPGEFGGRIDATGLNPGTYQGTITVGGPGNSVAIAITIRVSSSAQLSIDPATATFNLHKNQTPPGNQVINITSTGASFAYQTTVSNITPSGAAWLVGGTNTGNTPGILTLGVNSAAASALANGQYTATIAVTTPPGFTPPITTPSNINVVLNVSDTALFNVSPATIDFFVAPNGPAPQIRTVAVTATDNSSRPFTATGATSSGGNWLLVGPNAGNTPSNLSVSVIPQGLGAGVYEGTIQVTVPSISTTAQTVRVRLIVQPTATFAVAPSGLSFSQSSGGAAPATRTLALTGTGGSANFQVTTSTASGGSWLSVSPSGGTVPATLTVSVNGANLVAGTYTGSIGIASNDVFGGPLTVPVTLTVTAPGLTLTPTALSFTAVPGSSISLTQQVSVAASGATAPFTVLVGTMSGGNWLSVSALTGITPSTLTVTANPSGLAAGTYSGFITVTAPNVNNSPQTLPVTFTIAAAAPPGRQLLSQIADGDNWKTTVILVNLDSAPAPFTLRFFSGTGAAMRLPIEGSPGRLESIEGTIPVGGSRTIITLGTDTTLSQGWAELTSSRVISGLGIFRQRSAGRADQEAAVSATTPATRFVVPYDNTQGFVSSMALVNTNATQSRGTSITPRDEAGSALPGNTINLPPLGHSAFEMAERLPSIAGRRGSAEFVSTGADFSALGLRFSSRGAFTSLPALTIPASGVIPTSQVISQVADGAGWKTSITLVNLDTVPAPFSLRFWRQNGTALPIPIAGAAAAELIEGTIPVGGTRIIETLGSDTGDLVQGWAELASTRAVSGLAVFRNRVAGRAIDQEAAVGLTVTSNRFVLAFDNTGEFTTSMALVNASSTFGATISVVIRDENGLQIGAESVSLPGRGYTAFGLIDRLAATRNRRGTAEFSSSNTQITGLGLRFSAGAFTSFRLRP